MAAVSAHSSLSLSFSAACSFPRASRAHASRELPTIYSFSRLKQSLLPSSSWRLASPWCRCGSPRHVIRGIRVHRLPRSRSPRNYAGFLLSLLFHPRFHISLILSLDIPRILLFIVQPGSRGRAAPRLRAAFASVKRRKLVKAWGPLCAGLVSRTAPHHRRGQRLRYFPARCPKDKAPTGKRDDAIQLQPTRGWVRGGYPPLHYSETNRRARYLTGINGFCIFISRLEGETIC